MVTRKVACCALSGVRRAGLASILGLKIAGRAKTDEAPQWFGNLPESVKMVQ